MNTETVLECCFLAYELVVEMSSDYCEKCEDSLQESSNWTNCTKWYCEYFDKAFLLGISYSEMEQLFGNQFAWYFDIT